MRNSPKISNREDVKDLDQIVNQNVKIKKLEVHEQPKGQIQQFRAQRRMT